MLSTARLILLERSHVKKTLFLLFTFTTASPSSHFDRPSFLDKYIRCRILVFVTSEEMFEELLKKSPTKKGREVIRARIREYLAEYSIETATFDRLAILDVMMTLSYSWKKINARSDFQRRLSKSETGIYESCIQKLWVLLTCFLVFWTELRGMKKQWGVVMKSWVDNVDKFEPRLWLWRRKKQSWQSLSTGSEIRINPIREPS